MYMVKHMWLVIPQCDVSLLNKFDMLHGDKKYSIKQFFTFFYIKIKPIYISYGRKVHTQQHTNGFFSDLHGYITSLYTCIFIYYVTWLGALHSNIDDMIFKYKNNNELKNSRTISRVISSIYGQSTFSY